MEDGRIHFVDATTVATRLLGDAIYANFFLLGAAYQQGLIPISAESITAAIELNAVAVEQNRQAFLWGRRYVDDAAGVLREAGIETADKPETEASNLDELIASRHDFLVDYQDEAYARRYLRLLEQVREVESKLQTNAVDAELPLTKAVAQAYFKLLAYKDEYEVARLYSNGDFEKSLAAQFEGNFRLGFHLAPPLLAKRDPNTGKPLKREFGGWVLPLFRILARCKRLRGGALDIFGYSAERKMERALITDYEKDIEEILTQVNPQNLEIAVELAELPLQLRGFGHVKQASIDGSRQRHGQLSRQLSGRDLAVELFSP
jgi:indolepyruvate ferredoxin oxidoreductase